MAVKKTALLLTASLSMILSLHFLITPTKADEALIKRLCEATKDPQTCEKCLDSDPSSKSADEIGLAENSMTCGANDMGLLFQNTFRLQENSTDPQMKGALGVCLDRFEEAKNKINGISDKVKSKDFKTAQGKIKSEILDPVNFCDYVIKIRGFQVPEIVSKGMGDVTRDWNIVVGMLGAMK